MNNEEDSEAHQRARLRLALRIDQGGPAAAAWFDSLSAATVAGLYETGHLSFHRSMPRPDLVVDAATGLVNESTPLAEVVRSYEKKIKADICRTKGLKTHGAKVLDVLLDGDYVRSDSSDQETNDKTMTAAFFKELKARTELPDSKVEKLARDAFKAMFRSLQGSGRD